MSNTEQSVEERLQNLEAAAFRTGVLLAEHSERIEALSTQRAAARLDDLGAKLDEIQRTRRVIDAHTGHLEQILATQAEHTSALRELKGDVSELKGDVSELKTGMAALLSHFGLTP